MQVEIKNFQNLEVELHYQIIDILHEQKNIELINLQLNLFDVQNQFLCFNLLISKRLHFESVILLDASFEMGEKLKSILNYWILQGLDFQAAKDLYQLPSDSLDNCLSIIDFINQSPDRLLSIFNQLPLGSKIVLFKKFEEDENMESIWTFMHPFWAYFEIKAYREFSFSGEFVYILYGIKR
jgi:hypothetical protein